MYHDPLVAYVDKRLEPLDQLILLDNLCLQPLDLLLAVFLQFLQLISCLAQLPTEIGTDPFLRRRVGLAVYRRSIRREILFNLLRIPVDGRSRVVYVAREDRGVRVLFLQDLESLGDPDTWTWLGTIIG